MALEGGSFGFQIGGEATDFVLLVMNDRGRERHSRQQGQVGRGCFRRRGTGRVAMRRPDTDVTLRAEILSYSRAPAGLFAGGLSRRFHNPSGQWRQPPCVRQEDSCEGYCSVPNGRRAPSSRAVDLDPGCQDPEAQAVGPTQLKQSGHVFRSRVVDVAELILSVGSSVVPSYFRSAHVQPAQRRKRDVANKECGSKNVTSLPSPVWSLSGLLIVGSTPGFSANKSETIGATAMGTSTQMGSQFSITLNIYDYSTQADKQISDRGIPAGQGSGVGQRAQQDESGGPYRGHWHTGV